MTNEQKASEIAKSFVSKRIENSASKIFTLQIESACKQMAQWKDEQLESKLMQIIILAQQGYTSGATDEMILRQCKEIINENYEHNTTKTD